MPTTSPLCVHAAIPAIVFDVPAGTDLLTIPRPAPSLADPTRAIAQALLRIANSSDGIGAPEYVHELQLSQSLPGPRDDVAALFQRPVVQKDQWEVEMWCRVLEQVGGPAGLTYCTTGIPHDDLEKFPLT